MRETRRGHRTGPAEACRARKRTDPEVAYNGYGTYRGLPSSDTNCVLNSDWNAYMCRAEVRHRNLRHITPTIGRLICSSSDPRSP